MKAKEGAHPFQREAEDYLFRSGVEFLKHFHAYGNGDIEFEKSDEVAVMHALSEGAHDLEGALLFPDMKKWPRANGRFPLGVVELRPLINRLLSYATTHLPFDREFFAERKDSEGATISTHRIIPIRREVPTQPS